MKTETKLMKIIKTIFKNKFKKRREGTIPEISFHYHPFKTLIVSNPKKLKEGLIIRLDKKNKLEAIPF